MEERFTRKGEPLSNFTISLSKSPAETQAEAMCAFFFNCCMVVDPSFSGVYSWLLGASYR